VKILSALLFLSTLTSLSIAQIAPAPGMSPAGQAQQALFVVQAQSMVISNQAQLQGLIFAQASMLTSAEARSMFMVQAAALQARVSGNQSAMFAQQAALSAMRRSITLQSELQVRSAILSMRGQGAESAFAMQNAVQLASLDPAKSFRRMAMLHAEAAQASGQTQPGQAAAAPPSSDDSSLPAEPPPMMVRPTFGNALVIEKPKFSVESGTVDAGAKVRIRCETHYATLYYTTNGWTPTTQSAKYSGPITIDHTTHLQVIAVGPNFLRSTVEHADYEVRNSQPPALESTILVPDDGVLRAGTPMRVVFSGNDIDSDSAEVGDPISVVLDEDIKLGKTALAPKGAPVNAALTTADPGHGPAPGDLVFEIHSVQVGSKRIPLFGGETLEGVKGGKNATIKVGMTAMAFVAADTVVK
jgi:hypothetical protein